MVAEVNEHPAGTWTSADMSIAGAMGTHAERDVSTDLDTPARTIQRRFLVVGLLRDLRRVRVAGVVAEALR